MSLRFFHLLFVRTTCSGLTQNRAVIDCFDEKLLVKSYHFMLHQNELAEFVSATYFVLLSEINQEISFLIHSSPKGNKRTGRLFYVEKKSQRLSSWFFNDRRLESYKHIQNSSI